MSGFEAIEPGRNLEVTPTVTAMRTDRLSSFPDGELESGDERGYGFLAEWEHEGRDWFWSAGYQDLDLQQDPALFTFPVEPEVEDLFTQVLFSYKVNPQTVLFLGYSDARLGLADVSLTQTERTFFAKIGYAWTL